MTDITPSEQVLEFAERIFRRADGIDEVVPVNHQPDWLDRPYRFRAYAEASRIMLPSFSELYHDYLAIRRRRNVPPGAVPTLANLALASYLMLAPLRRKLDINWNADAPVDFTSQEFGRGTASGGGLYPTQLYWVTAPTLGIPASVYHYSPSDHTLTTIRRGDWTLDVAAASTAYPPDRHPSVYLVLATDFWMNCFKYHNFGLHVCGQDIGAAASSLQIICDALGIEHHGHLQFEDDAVNRIIGADGRHESTFAVIGIGPLSNSGKARVRSLHDISANDSPKPLQRSKRTSIAEELTAIHRLTCLSRAELDRHSEMKVDSPPPAKISPSPEGPLEARIRDFLPAIMRQRRSAWGSLNGERPVAAGDLRQLMRFIWRRGNPSHKPFRESLPLGSFGIHAYLNHVDGENRGFHRWEPETERFVRAAENHEIELQKTYGMGNYNLEEAACLLFVTADLPVIVRRYGPRGYRILNVYIGLVAQAAYLGASASRFDCGAVLGVRAQYVKKALRLEASCNVCLAIYLSTQQEPAEAFDYSLTPGVPVWEPLQ